MKHIIFICLFVFTVPAWGQYVDPYIQPINPYQFAPLTPLTPLPYTGPSFYDEGRQQFQLDNLRWEQQRANREIDEIRQANRDHERLHRRQKRF